MAEELNRKRRAGAKNTESKKGEGRMKRRTEGHPILPIDVFSDLYDAFGEEISTEILDRVQERQISVEEAREYLKYAQGKEKTGKVEM